MANTIDFRSDTVTRPTPAMRDAMRNAIVGDDVYGEDATVNALQDQAAAMLGYEAGLYGVSGTQTNLLALMSHCQRGEEVIVGQMAHTYRWEGGGMAVLGSIQPQPLAQLADGTIDLVAIEGAIKPDDAHYAMTRLIALENTWGGKVLPADYAPRVKALAERHGLGTHLDGARLFNAAVFTAAQKGGTATAAAREICASFDSVSMCLSKGLGAPVGSLLLGSRQLINRAHRLRKMIGGGMRQAGVIAAAGIYALEHNIDRLADDHANAKLLAKGLAEVSRGHLTIESPQTNIVWAAYTPAIGDPLATYLQANGILVSGTYGRQRWVTHLDVTTDDVERAVGVVESYFAKSAKL
jgi:threonine aldolase